MFILIFEGKRLNDDIKAGIIITVKLVSITSDHDIVELNYGPGMYLPGVLVCKYRGKKVPSVIR